MKLFKQNEQIIQLTNCNVQYMTTSGLPSPEMESRIQGSRPRPRTQKNPGPRPSTDFPRTDPLEAKDRNARGQEPRTQRASVFQKKVFPQKNYKFLRKFRRSPKKTTKKQQGFHKVSAKSLASSKTKSKNGHDLGPFPTNQKIELSSSRAPGIFEDLQISRQRPRT